jgi:hypothetical protein
MTATLELEGVEEFQRALKKLGKDAEAAVSKATVKAGLLLQGDIQKRIQRGPKTGAIYTRGNVSHQASAPGQSPATDTGRLVSNTLFKKTSVMSVEVFNTLQYAPLLEFGTTNIDPRPAWIPAIQKISPIYRKDLEAALGRAMK